MRFGDIYQMVLDKLNLHDGDRRAENVIKNAINTAYLQIAEKDTNPIEIEQELENDSNIIYLPSNFLSVIRIEHPTRGVLNTEDYRINNNRLLLGTHIPLEGTMKVLITIQPDELINDDDIPQINSKYHFALMYYALFVMTDNIDYLGIYNNLTADLDYKGGTLHQAGDVEVVQDEYFGV